MNEESCDECKRYGIIRMGRSWTGKVWRQGWLETSFFSRTKGVVVHFQQQDHSLCRPGRQTDTDSTLAGRHDCLLYYSDFEIKKKFSFKIRDERRKPELLLVSS